jgi:transcriptional regulator with XRE-family HTH domain
MSTGTELGEALRAAREAKGLTTADVAGATRLKLQAVEDLERNDFSRVAAPIYGKGFIRLYAECVGLDPKPLVETYLTYYARATRPSLEPEALAHAAANPPRSDAERRPREPASAALRRVGRIGAEVLAAGLERAVTWSRSLRGRIIPPPRRVLAAPRLRPAAVPSAGLPAWQYAGIAAGVLLVLVLVLSGISRYVRSGRTRRAEGGAPAVARSLRLAEEPVPPYLRVAAP